MRIASFITSAKKCDSGAEDEHEFVDYREAYELMPDMADYMERRLQPMRDWLWMPLFHHWKNG